MKLQKILATILISSALFGIASAATIVVDPNNMDGWSFLTTDNNGNPAMNGNTAQMVFGPATPPLGVGSAQLATAPGQGDTSSQILTNSYNGDPLSTLTSLSYSTYDTVNNGQQFPYLKISLSDGNALFFEPPYQTPATGGPGGIDQGPTIMSQWQTWNALAGGWWDNNAQQGNGGGGQGLVYTLGSYETLNPGVLIEGISLRVGYASPGDNFNGYVDNVTIGVNGADTTFNFEPVPEPTTWVAASLAGLVLIVQIVRARSFSKHALVEKQQNV